MNRWTVAGAAALTVIAVVMLATVRGYGMTWDEQSQSAYGELVIGWYRSGFHNDGALTYRDLYLYAGLFDVFAQLVAHVSPLDLYTSRHIVNVAFALTGLAGTWRLGVLVIGARGGFLAMGLTALTPMFYGHSFNNPKDIPFAVVFVWTLCFLLESTRSIPDIRLSSIAKLTASFGALLATRPGGIFVFGYIVLWWVLSFLRYDRYAGAGFGRLSVDSLRAAIRKTVIPLAAVLGGAWLIMLAFWPWGQVNPIINPLLGMRRAARFSFTGPTLFFGQQVPARPAPVAYVPTWFALQLPEIYLVALAAGLLPLAMQRTAPTTDEDRQRAMTLGFLAFVVVFPVLTAVLLRSALYDAVRHFLFLIPALAVLAAAAIEHSLRSPMPRSVRAAIVAAALAAAAFTVRDMAALHPYESVYFNRLVAGGLRGVDGRFETDYWGNSYREGIEWVMKNVPGEKIRVANCSNPFQTSYYLEGSAGTRFIPVLLEQNPDILLATTRGDCYRKNGGRVLYTVERQGVVLLYVFDLRRKSGS
jgi:hypothetical protein